jgi:hypothetical protein
MLACPFSVVHAVPSSQHMGLLAYRVPTRQQLFSDMWGSCAAVVRVGVAEQECQPRTGKPSQCAVEMLTLELRNPPARDPVQSAQHFNFTMMIHGDVFKSSPDTDKTYFEMPIQCSYERNHSVLAMFNASSGDVTFEILDTHSDKVGCFKVLDPQPVAQDRCTPTPGSPCYPMLVGKKFQGKFRLGPRRVDDAAGTKHHLELVIFYPYKHFGIGSWSDFKERHKTPYVPIMSIPASISSWTTNKAAQIFRYSLTPSPQHWMGPNDEWFRDRRPRIHAVDPPFGPEEGGPMVTIKGVEFPEPDPGSKHNFSITLQHGKDSDEDSSLRIGGQVREQKNDATSVSVWLL